MEHKNFSGYKSVLIIGNGFDLSLGLPTGYMNFINSSEFQVLLMLIIN
ncbi:AbiH family protein [Bacteroides pyogenes]